MKNCITVAMALMMAVLLAGPAGAFELGAKGYYWMPSLGGDVRLDEGSILGTKIDFEDDLDIEDEDYAVGEVFCGIGRHHLSLSFYGADYEGSARLSQAIVFGGTTFNLDETVEADLEYDVIDVMYRYDLLDLENVLAGFSIGVVGRVEYIDGTVEIKSDTLTEKEDFSAPIPMVGLNFHVGLLADWIEARVLATGIVYSGNTLFDGMAELSITPLPFVDFHGGYRMFKIDADYDDIELNYDTSGPYVALSVSF